MCHIHHLYTETIYSSHHLEIFKDNSCLFWEFFCTFCCVRLLRYFWFGFPSLQNHPPPPPKQTPTKSQFVGIMHQPTNKPFPYQPKPKDPSPTKTQAQPPPHVVFCRGTRCRMCSASNSFLLRQPSVVVAAPDSASRRGYTMISPLSRSFLNGGAWV